MTPWRSRIVRMPPLSSMILFLRPAVIIRRERSAVVPAVTESERTRLGLRKHAASARFSGIRRRV